MYVETFVWYKLVGQLVGHQLVVGSAGRAALGLPLVEPEPHHGRVVLFACRESEGDYVTSRDCLLPQHDTISGTNRCD